jgi:hypothetical protein
LRYSAAAKNDPPADAKAWEDVPEQLEQHFSPDPGAGGQQQGSRVIDGTS